MKQRSEIDWNNPPEPAVFGQVELKPKFKRKPGVIMDGVGFIMCGNEQARKAACMWLPTLIFYVRQACMRYPAFREELEEMISLIPEPAPPADP